MSIELRNKVAELERRVVVLEEFARNVELFITKTGVEKATALADISIVNRQTLTLKKQVNG